LGGLRFFRNRRKSRIFFFGWSRPSSWGIVSVLSEKMGQNLKMLEKSQKCQTKKKYFLVEPVPLHASLTHQSSCNTLFLQEYFFFGESWEKCVLTPRRPRPPPVTPGIRVTLCVLSGEVDRWSPIKCKGASPRPKVGNLTIFFISTKMDLFCSGGFLGLP
jgi:hypothetical protein